MLEVNDCDIIQSQDMSTICRLASAIGYPQVVPADSVEFAFSVDGGEVHATDLGRRLLLTRAISREEDAFVRLATYCAGRILKEEASLYWDERRGEMMLAQEISATAVPHEMKAFFEKFADSCDWWLARTAAEPVKTTSFPEMVIRP